MEDDSVTWDYNAPKNVFDFNNVNEEESNDESYFKCIEGDETVEIEEAKALFEVDMNKVTTSTARKVVDKTNQELKEVLRKDHNKKKENDVAKRLNLGVSKSNTSLNCSLRSTRSNANSEKPMSREERELEEIRIAREDSKRIKLESQKSYKTISKPPTKHVFEAKVTDVSEFHFATDKRVKNHEMVTRSDRAAEVNFANNLRKPQPVSEFKPKSTIPKPFSFDKNSRKRKMGTDNSTDGASSSNAYVSAAKTILDFQKRTPARFHTASRLNKAVVPKGPMKAMKMTVPKTPNFASNKRARPMTHVESQADKDAKELAEIKSYKFEARPANKAILKEGEKLKKVEKKPTTKPIGFNFVSDKLVANTSFKKSESDSDKPFQFKARPAPKAIFDGVQGVQEKKQIPLTRPQSPSFKSKLRVRAVANQKEEEVATSSKTFYRPAPHSSGVYHVPHVEKKKPHITKVEPFKFDANDRRRFADKDKKIQEQLEEEKKMATAFRARPMPDMSATSLVANSSKSSNFTKPKPFKMLTEERVGSRLEQAKQELLEKEEQERKARQFKANTDYEKVIKSEPWKPNLEHKSTEAVDFELISTSRARKRQEYDAWRCDMEAEEMRRTEEEKEQQQREEEKQIKEMRKQMTTKAQPIRHFKPVSVKPSDKNLTIPQSPKFSDRFSK